MKRLFHIVLVLGLGLSAAVWAADEKINLSGTWVLDKEKSDPIRFGRPGQNPQGPDPATIEITLVITQSDNELQITRKLNERTFEQKFTLDGQENTNRGMGRGELKTKTKVKGGKIVTEGFQMISTPDRDFEMGIIEEYTLSENGNVLTIKTTRDTPRGQHTAKMIFNKQ